MLRQKIKKAAAIFVSTAILASGMTALAASSGHSEGEYGTKYIYSRYFKFNNDSNIFGRKLGNPEGYAAHISTNQSYSGTHSLYMDCCNAWWKQHFHTDFGCELAKQDGITESGETRYIDPRNKTFRFSCKITGDTTHIPPNAGLCDNTGIQVKFSDMKITEEEKNGAVWRTYSWEGKWPGTNGWLMGIGGTHACGAYIDDIKLECLIGSKWVTYINESFEDAANVDTRTVNFAGVTPINDNTLRISWKNPPLSALKSVVVYDVTDEANPVSVLDSADALPETVSLAKNANCYFDITNLAEKTYKKYKIVTTTDTYADIETIIDGRTLRNGENITNYNYDKNGWSFGGSWYANVGDNPAGDGIKNGSWYLNFDQKRSGYASFACDILGGEARLQYAPNKTYEAGKTYGIEWYAKAADGKATASATIFALTNGQTFATATGAVADGDWVRHSFEWTPTQTVTGHMVRVCFKSTYPTTIYVDDIRMYEKDGADFVPAIYTEAGHHIKNISMDFSNDFALTWDEENLDQNGVDGLGVNVYHIAADGKETKLNETPLAWTGAAGRRFSLGSIQKGKYEIRAVSEFGNEVTCGEYTPEGVKISDKSFSSVYTWVDGFSNLGIGADLSMPIQKIEKGDIMGSMNIGNFSGEPFEAALIGALYKGGTLVKTVINPISLAAGQNTDAAVAFQVGTESETDASGYKMSMFLWNSAAGLVPLTNPEILPDK
mgnify:CR=1 FL=1